MQQKQQRMFLWNKSTLSLVVVAVFVLEEKYTAKRKSLDKSVPHTHKVYLVFHIHRKSQSQATRIEPWIMYNSDSLWCVVLVVWYVCVIRLHKPKSLYVRGIRIHIHTLWLFVYTLAVYRKDYKLNVQTELRIQFVWVKVCNSLTEIACQSQKLRTCFKGKKSSWHYVYTTWHLQFRDKWINDTRINWKFLWLFPIPCVCV